MAATQDRAGDLVGPARGDAVWLAAGFCSLAVPTAIRLAQQDWSRDFGAYGPIILAAGAWLLWRQFPAFRRLAAPGSSWITGSLFVASATSYVFGRAYDFLTLETAGVYGIGVAILFARVGGKQILSSWFPLLYLAFVIPIPNAVLADITSPLKAFVSLVATGTLAHLGVPVAREGVTIYVAQYQLLVEDACSGMNSLIGLIAVSLLYIYLMRGSSWRYAVLLVAFVVPIAITANIVRIMLLILMTYGLGNELAQGILHMTAGLILFATALLLVFGLDSALHNLLRKRSTP